MLKKIVRSLNYKLLKCFRQMKNDDFLFVFKLFHVWLINDVTSFEYLFICILLNATESLTV